MSSSLRMSSRLRASALRSPSPVATSPHRGEPARASKYTPAELPGNAFFKASTIGKTYSEPLVASTLPDRQIVGNSTAVVDIGAAPVEIKAGDVVMVGNSLGRVRFVGTTRFARGYWVGVEFNSPIGNTNGVIEGHTYFRVRRNHGRFVRPSQVRVVTEEDLTKTGGKLGLATARVISSRSSAHFPTHSFYVPGPREERVPFREAMYEVVEGIEVGSVVAWRGVDCVVIHTGRVYFARGKWVGLDLQGADIPTRSGNNGKRASTFYRWDGNGIFLVFVKESAVRRGVLGDEYAASETSLAIADDPLLALEDDVGDDGAPDDVALDVEALDGDGDGDGDGDDPLVDSAAGADDAASPAAADAAVAVAEEVVTTVTTTVVEVVADGDGAAVADTDDDVMGDEIESIDLGSSDGGLSDAEAVDLDVAGGNRDNNVTVDEGLDLVAVDTDDEGEETAPVVEPLVESLADTGVDDEPLVPTEAVAGGEAALGAGQADKGGEEQVVTTTTTTTTVVEVVDDGGVADAAQANAPAVAETPGDDDTVGGDDAVIETTAATTTEITTATTTVATAGEGQQAGAGPDVVVEEQTTTTTTTVVVEGGSDAGVGAEALAAAAAATAAAAAAVDASADADAAETNVVETKTEALDTDGDGVVDATVVTTTTITSSAGVGDEGEAAVATDADGAKVAPDSTVEITALDTDGDGVVDTEVTTTTTTTTTTAPAAAASGDNDPAPAAATATIKETTTVSTTEVVTTSSGQDIVAKPEGDPVVTLDSDESDIHIPSDAIDDPAAAALSSASDAGGGEAAAGDGDDDGLASDSSIDINEELSPMHPSETSQPAGDDGDNDGGSDSLGSIGLGSDISSLSDGLGIGSDDGIGGGESDGLGLGDDSDGLGLGDDSDGLGLGDDSDGLGLGDDSDGLGLGDSDSLDLGGSDDLGLGDSDDLGGSDDLLGSDLSSLGDDDDLGLDDSISL